MASWRHYGRSLRSFWSTSLAAELEYPLNAVIELVSVFGNLAGSLFVLQLLFAGGSSLGGWSWNGALVVLGLYTLLDGITTCLLQPNLSRIVNHVQTGTLDYVLLKPIDSQFWLSTRTVSPWGLPAIGAALGLIAWASSRAGVPSPALLMLALALLLARPDWLLDVGFQLSVVATAALVLSARPLELGLRRWLPGWLPGWLAAATAVPLAASLYTLPLQLLHFGVVPLYAVPANLVVAPLLTPLTLGAMALACLAVLLPPLLPLATVPVDWLCRLLVLVVQAFAELPMAQWQLGRPTPVLVLLLSLALLALVLPALGRRWRLLGFGLLALAVALHLSLLGADQLLLVHQGRLDLLVARHRGRAALVSSSADGFSCSQASQLARGLGVQRFDWALLLDPLAPEQPDCWQAQAGLVLASADGSLPLQPGQRLASEGLSAAPVAIESRAMELQLGRWRWLLLPDRQALWAWQERYGPGRGGFDGLWLGFRPSQRERTQLQRLGVERIWLSGAIPSGWPETWAASGPSGSLQAVRG